TDAQNVVTYTFYDQVGRVTRTVEGANNEVTINNYDDPNNPNSARLFKVSVNGTQQAAVGYDAAGRLHTVSYGNTTTLTIPPPGSDSSGTLTGTDSPHTSPGAFLTGNHITKNPAGRTTMDLIDTGTGALVNPRPGGGDDYTYDPAGRLTHAYLNGARADY